MSEKLLILTVGLPRSGKSTWAREQRLPIVNPDSIRLALHGQRFYAPAEPWVWAIAYLMVDALFKAGHYAVIVDATNITEKRREEWRARVKGIADVSLAIIPTLPAVCKRRAEMEGDTAIIPVIERMAAEWDLPKPEGWNPKI